MRMKDMLWIEDIVGNTITLPFLTNFRVDMVSFVNPHKVVFRRSAFSTFPSARNEYELESRVESERLKHIFSQVKGDLHLQKIPKLILIPKKRASREKVVMMKDEDEGGENAGKIIIIKTETKKYP
jgi:hypothetical protein